MPELPEVETVKNILMPHLAGCRFVGVSLLSPEQVRTPSPEEFRQRLVGQAVTEVGRRGKYLLLRLSAGDTLLFHFRMTGVLLLEESAAQKPYTRAVFLLEGGQQLHFCDKRKLGGMWLVKDERPMLGHLGPEPLSPEFTLSLFHSLLRKRSGPVKAVLCDQTFLAGVGNMYADEALFAASIHPLRRARDLSPEQVQRLYFSLRQILKQAILNRGASVQDYIAPDSRPGDQQKLFQVAHRRGQDCFRCGTRIERITIRGRGAYFCPLCQVLD